MHQNDEQLELYALGRLPEPLVEAVEEHLLVCTACQERLDEVESFSLAMRQAIAAEPPVPAATDWFAWFRAARLPAAPRWSIGIAAGFAALLLAAFFYLHPGRNVAPLAFLQLTAMRGETPSVGIAGETDITLADLPGDASQIEAAFRVELVDATGGTVWNGALPPNVVKLRILKQLDEGSYFVRLYDGSGKLLHEYAFRVRNSL